MIIKCPNCGQSLPDTFTTCQFCGADVTLAPRQPSPLDADDHAGPSVIIHKPRPPAPTWPRKAYIAVLIYWMLAALGGLAMDFVRKPDAGPISYHALLLLTGLLLLLQVDLAERFVQYVCWFQILFGALELLTAAGAIGIIGTPAIVFMLLTGVNILVAALTLYLVEAHGVLEE